MAQKERLYQQEQKRERIITTGIIFEAQRLTLDPDIRYWMVTYMGPRSWNRSFKAASIEVDDHGRRMLNPDDEPATVENIVRLTGKVYPFV